MKLNKQMVLLLVSIATLLGTASCGTQKKMVEQDTREFRYELEPGEAVATQGSVTVKVWSYSKQSDLAIKQSPKNAVHGVIFKGYASKDRIPAAKALVQDMRAEQQHSLFFADFFKDGGEYMKFVTLVNNGVPALGDRLKVGKEYKVGVSVTVQKDALRKYLENSGVIRRLDSGF